MVDLLWPHIKMSLGLVLHLILLLVLAGFHPSLLLSIPLALPGLLSDGVSDGGGRLRPGSTTGQ